MRRHDTAGGRRPAAGTEAPTACHRSVDRGGKVQEAITRKPAALHVALLLLAYCAAFGPLALINQAFWDDGVVLDHTPATLFEMFNQAGRSEHFLVLVPFTTLGVPFAWTATSTLLYGSLPPLIYLIVLRATNWAPRDAFWVAMLTALAPLNQARFPISTLPYAFSCVFFALAVLTYLRDLERPSWGRRIATSLLLLASYPTNSFLVLSWILPALGALHSWRMLGGLSIAERMRRTAVAVLARGELLALPFVYWVCKLWLQPVQGLYQNYNTFRMPLGKALIATLGSMRQQLVGAAQLLPDAKQLPQVVIATVLVALAMGAIAHLGRISILAPDPDPKAGRRPGDLLAALVGLLLLFTALFPYILVDQPPRFMGLWETRHQTTMMLVAGFALYAVLRLIVPRVLVGAAAGALALGFLAIDITTAHRVMVDAHATRATQIAFAEASLPRGAMVLVIENDRQLRALGRHYAFYEITRLANVALGGSAVFAFSNREVVDPATDTYPQALSPPVFAHMAMICSRARDLPQYGYGGFSASGPVVTIHLTGGREPPGLLEGLRLAWLGIADPAARDRAVRGLTTMKTELAPTSAADLLRRHAPDGTHEPCGNGGKSHERSSGAG